MKMIISVFIILLFTFITTNNAKNKIISINVYNNLKNDKLLRNLQDQTDENEIEFYNINIIISNCQLMTICMNVNSQPELPNNISFLLDLNISKYNDTLRSYTNKIIEARALEYNENKTIYHAIVEDLISNENINLQILNMSIEFDIFPYNLNCQPTSLIISPNNPQIEGDPPNNITNNTILQIQMVIL